MDQEVKKLSYEELERALQQYSVQVDALKQKNGQLIEILNQSNIDNTLKRLDWLWAIMTTKETPLPESFINKCTEEFIMLMTPPENTEE